LEDAPRLRQHAGIRYARVRLFNQDTKVQALKRAPLFEGLSKKELTQLARVTEDLEVPAGEVLCREGDTGQEFFVIVNGETEVTTGGKRVATRGGGDFVGEIALLEDTRRTATVTAKTPLHVFVLTRQDFRRLVDANPSVERKVMHALARRVVELSRDPTVA
jgi:CRP/FNR family cyclic AMP-dependent transcriptional regulator